MAKCFTVFDVLFFRSLTRSILVWLGLRKTEETYATHVGMVAENIKH